MSTTTETARARLSVDGSKILIRGYNEELLEFVHSLPSARFHRAERCWSCDTTPAAAWRVYRRPEFLGALDERLEAMAVDFSNRVIEQRTLDTDLQPPVRQTDAWRHQLEAYWFALYAETAMLAMDMGTGKSKVAVDLVVNWHCNTVLILCPKSVIPVWRREFRIHAAEDVLILNRGSVATKKKNAENYRKRLSHTTDRVVIVINYESAWRTAFANWSLSVPWDCVILDESHRAMNSRTATSKYTAKLGKKARYKLCLTGTPMPHSPLDVKGQYDFLDPGLFGTSYHHFSNRYALKQNAAIPQQITGYQNQEELAYKFGLLAYRVEAEDVLDLPEIQHHERICQLGPKARRAYGELERDLITELESGVVTASNALVKLLRLQQCTSGFLVEDETKIVHEIDTAKADVLRELLEDINLSEDPVVVFCKFTHDVRQVQKITEEMGFVYGELSGNRRDGLDSKARLAAGVNVLGTQIQAGKEGVDFSRSRYAVYYSIGFSLGDYLQSLKRLHRPGQTRPVNYYHLICDHTVDRQVYRALERKENLINAVLKNLKGGDS